MGRLHVNRIVAELMPETEPEAQPEVQCARGPAPRGHRHAAGDPVPHPPAGPWQGAASGDLR